MIIPAFNEADSLPGVLAELAKHNPDHDLVVVDDGSTDDTAVVARAAGATCLRLPFNLGIGGALRLGFRYAVEQDYDQAYQFDAVPPTRSCITTGTSRTVNPRRTARTRASTASMYSTGYSVAKSSRTGRRNARKPDEVSVKFCRQLHVTRRRSRAMAMPRLRPTR